MSVDPKKPESEKTEKPKAELTDRLPQQIEIDVDDPAVIAEEFDEADFDHEFDDDFEEEIEGEYDLEDDQYGEDFKKEFGHLTEDEDTKPKKDKKG